MTVCGHISIKNRERHSGISSKTEKARAVSNSAFQTILIITPKECCYFRNFSRNCENKKNTNRVR